MSFTDRHPAAQRERQCVVGARRDPWAAIKRGLRGRCPACGEGHILHAYLKVHDACPACGEEFHHHRADDFPPYLTIFVVGHILGAAMFTVDDLWQDLPITFHFVTWPLLCIVMSLWLLPIFKGALVAYQWALRMHGFETAHAAARTDTAPTRDLPARDLPARDLPARDLPARDLPARDLPARELPTRDLPTLDLPSARRTAA